MSLRTMNTIFANTYSKALLLYKLNSVCVRLPTVIPVLSLQNYSLGVVTQVCQLLKYSKLQMAKAIVKSCVHMQ